MATTLALVMAMAAMALAIMAPPARAAAPPRTLRFEQLSVEHGLAQESVLAIAQDRQGFIWLGTQASPIT